MNPFRSHRSRGFTLVELLIVAALIAIFAGLAVINVQQTFRNNQRKAVIGEARQVATALDLAYNDIGIFPKICFLQGSVNNLQIESQRLYGASNNVFNIFHHYGIPTVIDSASIRERWLGPYFSPSQSRSGVSQGRGGSRLMQVTTLGTDTGYPWPLDPWNNPYMLYTLNQDREGALYFSVLREDNPEAPNTNANAVGNFVNAVVSYGPNQVPGGSEIIVPAGTFFDTGANTPFGLRLYRGDPNNTANPLQLLSGSDLAGTPGRARANVWGVTYANRPGGGGTAAFALDDLGQNPVGITDGGSDDVIFTF